MRARVTVSRRACELVSTSLASLRASHPSAVVRCSSASSSVSYMCLWSLASGAVSFCRVSSRICASVRALRSLAPCASAFSLALCALRASSSRRRTSRWSFSPVEPSFSFASSSDMFSRCSSNVCAVSLATAFNAFCFASTSPRNFSLVASITSFSFSSSSSASVVAAFGRCCAFLPFLPFSSGTSSGVGRSRCGGIVGARSAVVHEVGFTKCRSVSGT